MANLKGNLNNAVRLQQGNDEHTQRLGLFNDTELFWGTTMLHKSENDPLCNYVSFVFSFSL